MLNAQIAREAIAVKNAQIAYLRERIAQGSCCHGKFTAGYDMENACWTCEDVGYHTLEEQGYSAAVYYIQDERRKLWAKRFAYLVERYEGNHNALLQAIEQYLDLYKSGH